MEPTWIFAASLIAAFAAGAGFMYLVIHIRAGGYGGHNAVPPEAEMALDVIERVETGYEKAKQSQAKRKAMPVRGYHAPPEPISRFPGAHYGWAAGKHHVGARPEGNRAPTRALVTHTRFQLHPSQGIPG